MAKKKTEESKDFKEVDVMGMMSELKDKGETKLSDHIIDKETGEIIEKDSQMKKVSAEKKEEIKAKKEPQMVTVNGDEITHGHIFKSNNSDVWFFSAKINGTPLKCVPLAKDDTTLFFEKKIGVPELMQRYYPSKLAQKVPAEAYIIPNVIATPKGNLTIDKFNVYKETNRDAIAFGAYKFYAKVGDARMSAIPSKEDLNAYFDRTMSPEQLVRKNFGQQLGLPEYYQQFQLPQGVESKHIRIAKNPNTDRYEVSANFGRNGRTHACEIDYYDRNAFFSKMATKEQLAAKYLGNEISTLLGQANTVKEEKKNSMSMH